MTGLWFPAVLAVLLGAFLLPVMIWLYRLENWLTTWPLPVCDRAERRHAFEVQVAAFLARERRQGYQPPWSALRLFVRVLSTAPWDISYAVRALDSRVMESITAVMSRNPRLSFRLVVALVTLGTFLYAVVMLLLMAPVALQMATMSLVFQAVASLLCAMYVCGVGFMVRGLVGLHRVAYSAWWT
jgi:hypothetical protein